MLSGLSRSSGRPPAWQKKRGTLLRALFWAHRRWLEVGPGISISTIEEASAYISCTPAISYCTDLAPEIISISPRMSWEVTYVWRSSLIPSTNLLRSGMTPFCASFLRIAYWGHTSFSMITQPRFNIVRCNGRISIPFILIWLGIEQRLL